MLDEHDRPFFDLSSVRTGILAGAPCPVEVMKQVQSRMHMREVAIRCGMTETSPGSTQTAPDDPLEKRIETVGRPLDHTEIKIVDRPRVPSCRAACPANSAPAATALCSGTGTTRPPREAIDPAGWMHTGDLALMDDGYIRIVGRIKDVIIRGGENVYPREVEEFLHAIPGVAEAQVIGVPCERYGEGVMAWVRLREGAFRSLPRTCGRRASAGSRRSRFPATGSSSSRSSSR